MRNIIEKCKIFLYADDTLIFNQSETDEQCQINLELNIRIVNNYLKLNKLQLNENKTKIVLVNMNREIAFKIDNKIIEKVENIKYLEFIIGRHLNFKDHVNMYIGIMYMYEHT